MSTSLSLLRPSIFSRLRLPRPSIDGASAVLLFVAAFVLYARTVAPGVLDDDGGEFQTNMYRLGVSHTGYPLYFLLGKFWTLLVPVGNIAYRANLFSSLFGALTVVLIFFTMRTLVASRPAAIFTAGLFAVSRVEWSQSVIPRVYTLNSFFVVLVILLAILWRSGRISILWVAFAFGLSLTNHRTMIWLAPGLALFMFLGEGRAIFRPKRFLSLLGVFLLPLLLYLYVPLRGDSDVGVGYHAANFGDMILAGNASIWLRFGPPGFLWWRFTTAYLPLVLEQFTPIAAIFALAGIIALARKKMPNGFPPKLPPRDLLVLIAVIHIFETAFAIVFWTFDSEKYFIPSYLTFLILAGIGLAVAFERLARLHLSLPVSRLAPMALGMLLAGMAIFLLVVNFPGQDLSGNDLVQSRWEDILSQPLEPNALLIGNWESLTPLEYYQNVDNLRRDIERHKVVILRDQLSLVPPDDVVKLISNSLAHGQAVYMTLYPSQSETLGAVSDAFSLVPVASLWRVENKLAPTPAGTVGVHFGDSLVLNSLLLASDLHAGDLAEMQLNWRTNEALDARYKFSFRLRDSAGNMWLQRDADPYGGLKATTEWPTRQDIKDVEGIFIPPDAPPGDYALSLAVYDGDTHAALPADGSPEARLGTIHIASADKVFPLDVYQIPNSEDRALSGAKLLGYRVSNSQPRAGDPLQLEAWWSALDSGSSNVQVELDDASGRRTVLYQGSILPGAAGVLNSRSIYRAIYQLSPSPTLAPGRAALSLLDEGERVQVGDLELKSSDRQFTAPQVAHSQTAKIGGSIELLGYDFVKSKAAPGGQFPVKLYWHATAPVKTGYKVFVHLLDSNGILRAQQDSVPKSGSLPTDQWLGGEYISDEYTLSIPADVQPGDFQIEIGMYSQDTGVRMPALDASGFRLPDDRVLLGTTVRVLK